MSLLPAGSKLGRFQIASVLGQGAMGVVYLAHDPEIGRPVAIKTVRPEAVGGETLQELEARFLKEARLGGRLQHPNIVTVYDVGRSGDVCFIAMEYVDGRPLTRYLASVDALPLRVKVGVVRQVAEALGHAHERGVLHRDVKPGNILVGADGRVKVTDFGIGKFTGASTSELTRTGHMVGSPAYMSPEQVKGEKLDGRSDLFSLGIVLYELLTGARPFPGESITTLVYQILHTEPKDPLEWRADLPVATREVIARLLAKAPDRRPADAKAFVLELSRIEKIQRESEMTRRALAAAPPPARPAPTQPVAPTPPAVPAAPPPMREPPRRSGLPVILAALLVLAAASYFLLREGHRGVEPPPAIPESRPPALPQPTPAAAAPVLEAAPTAVPSPAAELVPTPAATAARPRTTPRRRATAAEAETAAPPAQAPPPAVPVPPSARPERVDAEYRTRRAVRFTSSPDQARLYLDGVYIGIADDWDNRGGGKELEFSKPGTHYVRMELPGYRTLFLAITVSDDADKDSPSIDDEMDRRDHSAYDRLPAPADRTTGAVEFAVEPSTAGIREGNRDLGPASAYGPGSPLELKGPAVHDLYLFAPGFKPRLVRVLVAPNAGKDRGRIKETLKPE
jgi:eukaryotic-like serine/threonine-protein kinase